MSRRLDTRVKPRGKSFVKSAQRREIQESSRIEKNDCEQGERPAGPQILPGPLLARDGQLRVRGKKLFPKPQHKPGEEKAADVQNISFLRKNHSACRYEQCEQEPALALFP